MKLDKENTIAIFAELGRRLETFGRDAASRAAIARASAENGWFSHGDITNSVASIRKTMLDQQPLQAWAASYPTVTTPKNVGVIMAGNIPLVGFFDLLCVIVSGHSLFLKMSSKDKALMSYMISQLTEIYPQIPIYEFGDSTPDAIIATGSDNTNRYFRSRYGHLPAIFRGSRSSAAVLDGNETPEELAGLADDIFTYSGLGCRNVSHLILPPGYDLNVLVRAFDSWSGINGKYMNNFRQRSSMLAVEGRPHTKGVFYILREDEEFPAYISEITWHVSESRAATEQWLRDNDTHLQCVVGQTEHPRGVPFGLAQSPKLTDYPDAVDVMDFLASI